MDFDAVLKKRNRICFYVLLSLVAGAFITLFAAGLTNEKVSVAGLAFTAVFLIGIGVSAIFDNTAAAIASLWLCLFASMSWSLGGGVYASTWLVFVWYVALFKAAMVIASSAKKRTEILNGSFWTLFWMSILSLGAYAYAWLFVADGYVGGKAGSKRNPCNTIFFIMFVPFYYIYWGYTVCKEMSAACAKRDFFFPDGSVLALILLLLFNVIGEFYVLWKVFAFRAATYNIEHRDGFGGANGNFGNGGYANRQNGGSNSYRASNADNPFENNGESDVVGKGESENNDFGEDEKTPFDEDDKDGFQ